MFIKLIADYMDSPYCSLALFIHLFYLNPQDSVQKKSLKREDEKENECQTPRTNPNVYISVSPRIFRKNIYHTNKLQREIIVHSKDNSNPIEFDPSVTRKPPVYLDIPNLYKRKRQDIVKKVYIYTGKYSC